MIVRNLLAWELHFAWAWRRREGVEVVEFVGFMPFLLVAGLILWQFLLFGHAMLTTINAAHQGVRAVVARQDPARVITSAAGNYALEYESESCRGLSAGSLVTVRVRLRIPFIQVPALSFPEVGTDYTAVAACEPT